MSAIRLPPSRVHYGTRLSISMEVGEATSDELLPRQRHLEKIRYPPYPFSTPQNTGIIPFNGADILFDQAAGGKY